MFERVYVRENLLCTSKIKVPYYSVPFYKKMYIWCVVSRTSIVLGNVVEKYLKCIDCHGKADVLRRKCKFITKKDIWIRNQNSNFPSLIVGGGQLPNFNFFSSDFNLLTPPNLWRFWKSPTPLIIANPPKVRTFT